MHVTWGDDGTEANFAPFRDEEAAYRFIEECVWPAGPVCPHCGTTRMGAYKCYECRRPFTVKVGTILESSNLPMHKWLQAIFLASGERGPMDASQLQHVLNVAPRTASYVLRRMRTPGPARLDEHAGKVVTKPG